MSHFSKNLHFLRQHQDLSPTDLAQHLTIDVQHIKDWEAGRKEPRLSTLQQLSVLFNTSLDDLVKVDLKQRDKHYQKNDIDLLVLDVDGVLTDGGMYYTDHGVELKKYNTKDGMAIKKLAKQGVEVGFISSGFNKEVVQKRADLLDVQYVYVGRDDKWNILSDWLNDMKLPLEKVAYIGDDVNDIPLLKKVGLSACPADAVARVKKAAQLCLTTKGGNGCVREFIDKYLVETTE